MEIQTASEPENNYSRIENIWADKGFQCFNPEHETTDRSEKWDVSHAALLKLVCFQFIQGADWMNAENKNTGAFWFQENNTQSVRSMI